MQLRHCLLSFHFAAEGAARAGGVQGSPLGTQHASFGHGAPQLAQIPGNRSETSAAGEHLCFLAASHPREEASGSEFISSVTPSQLSNNPGDLTANSTMSGAGEWAK